MPGFTNSRTTESTFGGGVGSCATTAPIPPSNKDDPNSNPVIFFMDADLLGRDLDWTWIEPIESKEGPDSGRHPKEATRSRAEIIREPLRSQAGREKPAASACTSPLRPVAVRIEKIRDIAIAAESFHRHIGSVGHPAGFDSWAVDAVEFPDERQDPGKVAKSM